MSTHRKILVTCALPYANGPIHVGHMLEHIEADIYARFQRMNGHECLFICADDTHGTPIMIAARKAGVTPEQHIEKSHADHVKDFAGFGISFDHYGSTNSTENRELCELFYNRLKEKGHIHKKPVDQLFCDNDKMFLPDRFVKGSCPQCASPGQYGDSCDICGTTYAPTDLKNPACSICGTKPVLKASDHIFFKLNDFQNYLREWLPAHTTPETCRKMLEWFDAELRDWDISRDAPYFGFEIPGEGNSDGTGKKYFYVWVDAPMGYVSSTAQFLKAKNRSLTEFWDPQTPTEIYHFIGKDIVYFHTLFWPALLQGADFKSPTKVHVHGHVMVNGEKMSKSKGTNISAGIYLKHLDPEHLRYYYATKLNASVDDLDLNFKDFTNRVNSDLVGKIVNLASRGAQMINKKFNGLTTTCEDDGLELLERIRAQAFAVAENYNTREFNKATTIIRELAEQTNRYFDEKAPWKTADSAPEETQRVLTTTLNAFRILAIYLTPVMPKLSLQVSQLFGETPYRWSDIATTFEGKKIESYVHLAQRVEPEKIQALIDEQKRFYELSGPPVAPSTVGANASTGTLTATKRPETTNNKKSVESPAEIEFSDFEKIDLRVATVIEAEEIKEADKLLRITVELAPGSTKKIIAGIKGAYAPEKIIGRQVLVCVNLKPRQMKFGTSEGMILAAGDGGPHLFLVSPDAGAVSGSRVK